MGYAPHFLPEDAGLVVGERGKRFSRMTDPGRHPEGMTNGECKNSPQARGLAGRPWNNREMDQRLPGRGWKVTRRVF